MFQEQIFTHHGRAFVIQADDWPDADSSGAATIDLQSWVIGLDQAQTAGLHRALQQETEALVHEMPYDRDEPPLPAVRAAQRRALMTGLQGRSTEGTQPTITVEAYQVAEA
jgi:hypothetical protein